MASRSSLGDAALSGVEDVHGAVASGEDLVAKFDSFLSRVASSLSSGSENDRTVLNWVVAARGRRHLLGDPTDRPRWRFQAAIIVEMQELLLWAADDAVDKGRITSTKGDEILAAWNAVW